MRWPFAGKPPGPDHLLPYPMDRNSDMRTALLVLGLLLLPGISLAADAKVSEAWIRLVPGGPSAGYFRLVNEGETRLALEGADCPGFARTTLHESIEEGGTSRMRAVERVTVAPGEEAVFQPGGFHLMLEGPTDPPSEGDRITCTLELAQGETIQAELVVRPPYAQGP